MRLCAGHGAPADWVACVPEVGICVLCAVCMAIRMRIDSMCISRQTNILMHTSSVTRGILARWPMMPPRRQGDVWHFQIATGLRQGLHPRVARKHGNNQTRQDLQVLKDSLYGKMADRWARDVQTGEPGRQMRRWRGRSQHTARSAPDVTLRTPQYPQSQRFIVERMRRVPSARRR